MDGLEVSMDFMDHALKFVYFINENSFSPKAITINGKAVQFTYEENNYRRGGAVIPLKQYTDLLNKHENLVEIWI